MVAGEKGGIGLKLRGRGAAAAIAFALAAFNVLLNLPLFGAGAQPYRGSIEAGYAGIARFFAEHPDPWGWNPFVYCGLPSQFVYLPGVPYAVALLMWLAPQLEALQAYRILVGLLACLGPSTLFLFASRAGGSMAWALAAAVGYSLCSPSYDLFPAIDADRGLLPVPWRLHVMVKYGEGPHNAGLMLIPLALWAVWNAAYDRSRRSIVCAAAALAAVALTHWIAAFALALAVLILMASHRGMGVPFRSGPVWTAGVLGYLMAAFWLTPSFVRTVAFNWPKDSFGFQALGAQRLAGALILAAVGGVWWLMGRLKGEPYLRFVTVCFLLFGAIAEAHYGSGVDPVPEARRYAIEMELFLALAAAEWGRYAWRSGNGVNRGCTVLFAALFVAQGWPQAARFVEAGYAKWQLEPKENTVEYRLASWIAAQHPRGRVYASGGLRFRLNSWFELQQVLGTFDSGLRNRTPLEFDDWFRKMAFMRAGREGADSLMQLRMMGSEYVVIHGSRSKEYYRDTKMPERFDGLLKPAYQIDDDRIYRIPFDSLAYSGPVEAGQKWLHPVYLEPLEKQYGDRWAPLDAEWEGTGRLRIRGPVAEGEVVNVAVSYAPGWRATQDGKAVRVERDLAGFLRIHARPEASADILLDYRATLEQKLCALLSVSVFGAALLWTILHWRRGNRLKENGI